jgi:hypothetical protein
MLRDSAKISTQAACPPGMRVKLSPFHPEIRRNPRSAHRIRESEFMLQHAIAVAEKKIG